MKSEGMILGLSFKANVCQKSLRVHTIDTKPILFQSKYGYFTLLPMPQPMPDLFGFCVIDYCKL